MKVKKALTWLATAVVAIFMTAAPLQAKSYTPVDKPYTQVDTQVCEDMAKAFELFLSLAIAGAIDDGPVKVVEFTVKADVYKCVSATKAIVNVNHWAKLEVKGKKDGKTSQVCVEGMDRVTLEKTGLQIEVKSSKVIKPATPVPCKK